MSQNKSREKLILPNRKNLWSLYSLFIIHEGHWVNHPIIHLLGQDTQEYGHLGKSSYCRQEEIISPGVRDLQIPSLKGDRKSLKHENNCRSLYLVVSTRHLLVMTRGPLMDFYSELAAILIMSKRLGTESVEERRLRWKKILFGPSIPLKIHTHTYRC